MREARAGRPASFAPRKPAPPPLQSQQVKVLPSATLRKPARMPPLWLPKAEAVSSPLAKSSGRLLSRASPPTTTASIHSGAERRRARRGSPAAGIYRAVTRLSVAPQQQSGYHSSALRREAGVGGGRSAEPSKAHWSAAPRLEAARTARWNFPRPTGRLRALPLALPRPVRGVSRQRRVRLSGV